MRLIEIGDHLINPELICHTKLNTYGYVDVYFAGLKKSVELESAKFLAAMRKEGLIEHERTGPQPRPPILPIEQGTQPGATRFLKLNRMWSGNPDVPGTAQASLDLLAGEEADE